MTGYESKLEKKDACQYCGGPHGDCIELRGGFLPEAVCKQRPTYQQLWNAHETLKVQYDDLLDELNEADGIY